MNKEFKKLLEASYTKGFEECARTGHKVGQLDAIFNSIVMGEFAQLIGRECLSIADSIRDECDKDGESQQALGAAWVGIAIARHFGIEE